MKCRYLKAELIPLIISNIGIILSIALHLSGKEIIGALQVGLIVIIIALSIYSLHVVLVSVNFRNRLSVMSDVNIIHSEIHAIEIKESNVIQEESIKIAQKIKESFEKLTGSKCNVCIRFLQVRNEQNGNRSVQMKIFARDFESNFSRNKDFDRGLVVGWEHRNSDFEYIINKINDLPRCSDRNDLREKINNIYYLNNDISKTPFRHEKYTGDGFLREMDSIPRQKRKKYIRSNNPCGYLSVLSIPIIPVSPLMGGEYINHSVSKPIGIISIDSINPNTFDIERDLSMLKGIADSVYLKLKHVK